jgi:glycine oxidase
VNRPTDVIVVGAGIVGCAIAAELSRRGASVEVIDDRQIGMGATQASAGVLAPYLEAHEGSPLLALASRSLALYDEFVARTSVDGGMALSYKRTGTLDVALDDADLRALKANAEVLKRLGVRATLFDGRGARAEEPLIREGATGALLVETHGFVAASELTRALAAAARRRGAQFVEPNRVRRIRSENGDVLVETDKGSLVGNAAVLAAGSWSADVEIGGASGRVPVRPVRGQLLWLGWRGAPLRRVTWTSRCYLVPWDDGTVLVGATMEEAGFDERATAAGVRDLLDAVCEIVPQASTAAFIAARVGLRPATPDALPIIGRSGVLPNLTYATGHFRNGVLLAPLTAQLVADLVLEDRADPILAQVAASRFGSL